MPDIEMPWSPRSRQQEGMASEARQAKKRGARVHPRSGAGKIKDDASDEDHLYEFKDAIKSHTLKVAELEAVFMRAARQGKEPHYIVKFGNGIVADIIITKEKP